MKKSTKRDSARESINASKELAKYLKDNKLDPEKDWSKDKKHGPKIKELLQIIQVGEAKANDKPIKLKKPKVHEKVAKVTKTPTSYDYPDVDGMPMSSAMKKKFRAKMRSLLKSQMEVSKASEKALQFVLNSASNSTKEDKPKKETSDKPKKDKVKKEKETKKAAKKKDKKVED